jgi:hypothetical protein
MSDIVYVICEWQVLGVVVVSSGSLVPLVHLHLRLTDVYTVTPIDTMAKWANRQRKSQ